MTKNKIQDYVSHVLQNIPEDWVKLTTHRLDIYNEALAKEEFLEQFEKLYQTNNADGTALRELPTAYDYIRLGHPLSSVLEWTIGKLNDLKPEHVISFSSRTVPALAVLRKNLLDNKNTRILYFGKLPDIFDAESFKKVYGYKFELQQIETLEEVSKFDGSSILISREGNLEKVELSEEIDFFVNLHAPLGSVLTINGKKNEEYISEIQHVRRRETVAMTPANALSALKLLVGVSSEQQNFDEQDKLRVTQEIQEIAGTRSKALVASSGLSMQYAIMMGLVDHAFEKHEGKKIKFIVPPNCYGGTNDQARRVAACLEEVEVLDLPVDRDNDMVQSLNTVLTRVADEDAVPFIIAEIPTNPRVEVPNLDKLREVLVKERKTPDGEIATAPVFILDQTFCPNVQFLKKEGILSQVKTISYVSGSKFPSGGKCTAGYCIANEQAEEYLDKVEKHLMICDNEATGLQYSILAEQLPSMNQRIREAYKNTREFVEFIKKNLPEAKINFVSEDLAEQGFTPSVFSLDLPTKGETEEEREQHKRDLNKNLINLMITKIPDDSKYCVSYGQLKGSYWTIPATSTQGTTKEGDKDYIARVSISPNIDLELHKKVFLEFVEKNDLRKTKAEVGRN
ncbi:MAG: cystathionine beta-synthase [Salinimicrobium sp.]